MSGTPRYIARCLPLLALVLTAPGLASAGLPTEDGYPSEPERAMVVVANAARADPLTWCVRCNDDCADYPDTGRAPLLYDPRGGRASRFHAQHIHDSPCFQHDSCCFLERVGDEVRCQEPPDPECTGCNERDCQGTGFSQRAALFDFGARAENISAGGEAVEDTVCRWLRSPGHRRNMLSDSHASLGAGLYVGTSCYRAYWVQKFGWGLSTERPRIVEGARIDGTWYGANYYDPDGTAPGLSVVVENGICHTLELAWGGAGEGTYAVTPSPPGAGCHSYYFVFIDGDGTRHTHPSEGALVFGGEGCEAYTLSRPDADCIACEEGETEVCYDGPPGTEGAGHCRAGTRTCVDGAFGPCDGQVLPVDGSCDDPPGGNGGAGGGQEPGKGDDLGPVWAPLDGGCTCAAGEGGPPPGWLFLSFLLVAFRMRRAALQAATKVSTNSGYAKRRDRGSPLDHGHPSSRAETSMTTDSQRV